MDPLCTAATTAAPAISLCVVYTFSQMGRCVSLEGKWTVKPQLIQLVVLDQVNLHAEYYYNSLAQRTCSTSISHRQLQYIVSVSSWVQCTSGVQQNECVQCYVAQRWLWEENYSSCNGKLLHGYRDFPQWWKQQWFTFKVNLTKLQQTVAFYI